MPFVIWIQQNKSWFMDKQTCGAILKTPFVVLVTNKRKWILSSTNMNYIKFLDWQRILFYHGLSGCTDTLYDIYDFKQDKEAKCAIISAYKMFSRNFPPTPTFYRTVSPPSIDHYFPATYFCNILKSEDGKTDTRCENSDDYRPRLWVGLVDRKNYDIAVVTGREI